MQTLLYPLLMGLLQWQLPLWECLRHLFHCFCIQVGRMGRFLGLLNIWEKYGFSYQTWCIFSLRSFWLWSHLWILLEKIKELGNSSKRCRNLLSEFWLSLFHGFLFNFFSLFQRYLLFEYWLSHMIHFRIMNSILKHWQIQNLLILLFVER